MQLNDNAIGELGACCNERERVWFFDGHIGSMSVDCRVDSIRYGGYEVTELVRIANSHPELVAAARVAEAAPEAKARIEQVQVRLLTADDLASGKHPCIITGGQIDPASRLHRAAAERFGGWGYVAEQAGDVCGFLGVLPKDLAQRAAAAFVPPGDAAAERVLLLTCFAGGVVFAPRYAGIGVGGRLVRQAVADARSKGYLSLEANPHDPGIGRLLEREGFRRVPWAAAGGSPLREPAFYPLDLAGDAGVSASL